MNVAMRNFRNESEPVQTGVEYGTCGFTPDIRISAWPHVCPCPLLRVCELSILSAGTGTRLERRVPDVNVNVELQLEVVDCSCLL